MRYGIIKLYRIFERGGKVLKKTLFSIFFAVAVIFGVSAYAEELTVLSGNTFVRGDYTAYGNNNEKVTALNTGASYLWTSDSDADIKTNDNGAGKMTDGNVLNHSGGYVSHSSWGTGTPSSAVFDLKDVYTVNRVDVWSSSTRYQQMGEICISVSEDGENYTQVGVWQAHIPDKEIIEQDEHKQGNSHTVCDFRDVSARYIKVSGQKADISSDKPTIEIM